MGVSQKTYVIAEAGVNHNGSLDSARQLIDVAAAAGADAVKFQTFKAEKVVSLNASKAEYQKETTGDSESQLEMIKKLELSEEAHKLLFQHCSNRNIEFLSTPFDTDSLFFLAHVMNLAKIKIPSGEITNAPFLLEIARTQKPVILSTGMSTLGEIELALGVLACGYLNLVEEDHKPTVELFNKAYCSQEGQSLLKEKVILLHCTTEYPAPYEEVNLRAIDTIRSAFGLPVGLSDHTQGIAVAVAAVARGACTIEKHFTLDKTLPGPDHKASLEPDELKSMIDSIRQVEAALGETNKYPSPSEFKNIAVARKSIVAAKPIKKGELFTEENIVIKRPGVGLSPVYYWRLLDKIATKAYQQDQPLSDD
jgi:N-acetylneuraminate synthase